MLIGLSELARQASTAGGGDAGTFGVAVSGLKVWKQWADDLADGCWNGRHGAAADAPRLFYGGTMALGDDPTRRGLANAIAGYVTSARNATPFGTIADVLPLLDAITTGGNGTPVGACPNGTLVPPTAAHGFDQDAPVITVTPAEPTPGVAPVVRGSVPVVALAVDPGGIDPRPTLRVAASTPAGFVDRDDDGDATDADVRFTVDSMAAVGPEGALDLTFESFDDSTNRGTVTRRLVVDNVAPVVTVDGVVDGGSYQPPRTISYGATDTHLTTVTATLDDVSFATGAAVVAPGLHTFKVVARDLPGNVTTDVRTFRIDNSAPVIMVAGVTHHGYHQPPVTITVSVTDDDLDAKTVLLDGATFVSGSTVQIEGPHSLVVTATDHAGHQSDTTIDFTLDGTDPVITIAGVEADHVYAPPRTITFGATDVNLATVTATLDGAPFATGGAVTDLGDHVLVVTATDLAGHQVQATRAFAIDGAPPLVTITGVLDQGFHQPPITIGFEALDPHLATVTATLDGMPIIDGTMVGAEGPHDLLVVAVDAAGNRTEASRHFTLDGTRPTVTIEPNLQTGGFYPRQAAVAFAGADVNLLSVTATLDGAPFNSGNAINADGEHVLRVVAVDKAGNQQPVTRTFTIDGVAPVITIDGVLDGGFYKAGVAVITYGQIDINPDQLFATLDGAPFASGTTVGGADGPRLLIVTAIDRAGNQVQRSRTFTIDATLPTVTIDPDLQTGGFYPRQAAVAFAGADANLLSVTATLDGAPFNSGNAINADGEHVLRVTAVDKAGNSLPVTRTFTIDGVPPVVSFGVVAANGFYQAGVRPTFAVVETNLQSTVATIRVGTGAPVPFASGDAVGGADGPRTIEVTATDKAGNATPASITFTLDGTPPTVSIAPDLLDGGFYPRQNAINYAAVDANLLSVTATLDGVPFATGNAILADGPHTLVVTAIDKAGNPGSTTRNFTIDGVPPVISFGVVAANGFYQAGVRPTFAVVETNLQSTVATIRVGNGAPVPFTSGDAVAGADGLRTVEVTVLDRAGNSTTESVTFTIDGTPPTITVVPDFVNNGFYQPQNPVTYGAQDVNLQAVTATLDGAPFASGAAILANGPHTLAVSAVDRAGNPAAPYTRTFTIDGIAPVITVNGVVDGGFYKPGAATITFSQNDANADQLFATLDGAPFASGTAVGGADGPRELVVTAIDKAGNPSSVTRTFTIDGTLPTVTIGNVVQGGVYRAPRAIQYAASDDNLLGVPTGRLTNGSGQVRDFASNAAVLATDEGDCTLVVHAVDKAGNVVDQPVGFAVDQTSPVIAFGGVDENGYHRPPVRPTFATPTEPHPGSLTATLNGQPFVSNTAILADGVYVLDVTAVDAAGNPSTASRTFTVDGTPPVLSLNMAGLTDYNGFLWTIASPADLVVSASDLNFAEVHAVVPFNVDVPGVDLGGGSYRLTIPAGKIRTIAPGTVISIIATDRAGNPTTVTRTFRYDAGNPVIAMRQTEVVKEDADVISYSTFFDAVWGVNNTTITHTRAVPPPTTLLGLAPNQACAAQPEVVKYGYLLDQSAPAYVVAASNPLAWQFTAADDADGAGLDLARVEYRVRDVAANEVVLDWTPATVNAPGLYDVVLYRRGTTAPSIPSLGTKAGAFQIEVRTFDRAGRSSIVTHCWNHRPLVAPLDLQAAQAPSHGPSGSGKYALNLLRLEDTTSPYDPIGSQVLSDGPANALFGTGLMQFQVNNATTEPVYLTLDFLKPGVDTVHWEKQVVLNKTTVDVEAGSAECGDYTLEGGIPFPAADTSLPWCQTGVPASSPGALGPLESGVVNSVTYDVRVWEQLASGAFVEISTNCPGCNQAPPDGTKVRRTVLLPARTAPTVAGVPSPQRKFWVMPVIGTIAQLRPGDVSPYTEFAAGGNQLTGRALTVLRRCNAPPVPDNGKWKCNSKRTITTFNALKRASIAVDGTVKVDVRRSFDGLNTSGVATVLQSLFAAWDTNEPAGL